MNAPRKPVASSTAHPVAEWRRWFVLGLLAIGALGIVSRAFYLQVVTRDFLVTEGDKRHIRNLTLQGQRGAVLDRNGNALALSAPVDSLWAVPEDLLTPAAAPYRVALAEMLGKKPKVLEQFLRKQDEADKRFVYLLKNQNPDVIARIL